MKRIVLIGFMGVGKTTIGRRLAKELGCRLIDTDETIEKMQGKRISEIFAEDGEAAFRNMETELLRKLLKSQENFVLSVGGGMPVREENRELLQKIGTVVYLKASKNELLKRLSGDKKRPLLQGGSLEERITSLMSARQEIYQETAHYELMTDGICQKEIVKELLELP